MDMVLYALLKKEMQNFEAVSGYKIKEVKSLPPDYDDSTIYIINPNAEDDDFNYIADKDGFVTIYKNKSWYTEKTWKFVFGLLDINYVDDNKLSTIYIEADLTKQDLDFYFMSNGQNFTEENEDKWMEQPYTINIYAHKERNKVIVSSVGSTKEETFALELDINSDNLRIALCTDYFYINGQKINSKGNAFTSVLNFMGTAPYFTIGGEKYGQGYYNIIGYYNYQMDETEMEQLTTNGRSDA